MWRTRYDDDWERRKEYLIRSLFEEVPSLSTVPEAEESCSQLIESPYSYEIRKASDVLPSTIESRPYSPLPPLIIEREPCRHDEPEEYYHQLEVKMRKLYKKLFIEDCSASSSLPDIDGGTENLSNRIEHFDIDVQMDIRKSPNVETNKSDKSNINDTSEHEELIEFEKQINNSDRILNTNTFDQKNTSKIDATILRPASNFDTLEVERINNCRHTNGNDEIFGEGINNNSPNTKIQSNLDEVEQLEESVNSNSTTNKKSSSTTIQNNTGSNQKGNKNNEPKRKSSSSTESSREYFQQITFEAQVHREDNVADVEKQSMVYESAERNVLTCADLREDGDEMDQERTDLFEDGDKNQVPSLSEESNITGPWDEEAQEIEMMRSTRIHHPSVESLNNELCDISDSSHFSTVRRKTRRRSLEIYSPRETIGDKTMDIERCDFSPILHCSTPKIKRKRRTNVEITPNNKLSRVFLSTSNKRKRFEDVAVQVSEKSSWSSLRGNFFVGSPKIFRLCCCRNHSCYC